MISAEINHSEVSLVKNESMGEELSETESMEPENEPTVGVLVCTHPGCMKEFSTRWSLNRHTRVHTGIKPYKCNFCFKEFAQNCSLKRHEQTHSQERVWVCDYNGCGKRFKLKEYLEVHHQRTHFKEEQSEAVAINLSDMTTVYMPGGGGAGVHDPTQIIEKLRERLVRMGLRHHDQLQCHQQREQELLDALREVADTLDESLCIIDQLTGGDPHIVPARMQNVARRYTTKNLAQHVPPAARAQAAVIPQLPPLSALPPPLSLALSLSNSLSALKAEAAFPTPLATSHNGFAPYPSWPAPLASSEDYTPTL